ncbi:LysR family transcriptional regulator [Pelosinus fermentans]|jgi:DNA-binding transcriptional LysR family regulator|uniref:Transcriptional regulator, LysR family n=1 Tax=Pelosinus fermentans JBW45 TaxID=1192197 RepID=I9NV26_9FIRM|nr:LysR family transcriptional regulator [Pelosinus fermentans]AJQ29844.1 transcriptional regulator, LysR family [Pelosinus fermentans JBW45]
MDIKQLKYFLTIAEEGQITRAAKRLHMAQPPLSQQLKVLEEDLGVNLVERESRGIVLTEAGHLLYKRAAHMLELLKATRKELKEIDEGRSGTLSIGAVASSGTTFLPIKIVSFHERYPHVNFNLREGDTNKILELLNTGVIEIGIVRTIFDPKTYHSVSLPEEPMVVAMCHEWNCNKEKFQINVEELANKPLLLHRSNENMIVECCQQNGFEPQIFCRGDDVRSLLVWADAGLGMAIVPKSAVGLVPSNKLLYKEIIDTSLEIRKAIIWLRNRYLSASTRNFIEMILSDLS